MRAAISGRAALAVLEDNGRWHSLHYNDLSLLVPRTDEVLPLLFRNVRDVEWLEADSIETVKHRLADAVDSIEGLDLVLYLLDETLSDDTRETAALEFEDLAVHAEVIELIENILLAEPLPETADISGALAACDRAGAIHTRAWLVEWQSHQPQVRQVIIAWRALPADLIGNDRETATAACLKFGVFRALVRALNQHGKASAAKLAIYPQHTLIASNIRAEVLKSMGRFEDALAAYDAVRKQHPDDVVARNGRASLLVVMGRHDEALMELPTARPTSLSDWMAAHVRAMIYLRTGHGSK